MFRSFVLLAVSVALLAGAALATQWPGIVNQTADDRVYAQLGDFNCTFIGPVNERIYITCAFGKTVKLTTTDTFVIGDCFDGGFDDGRIHWKLCRPEDQEYTWDVAAGPVEHVGQLF